MTKANIESPWPDDAPTRRNPAGYVWSDYGNAERLIDQHGIDLRYCHPWKKWLAWDGQRWAVDDTAEVMRRAKATVRAMYDEVSGVSDDKDRAAFLRFIVKSEGTTRLEQMVKSASSQSGVPVKPDELDGLPWLLNTASGTVGLKQEWRAQQRRHHREDMLTKIAGCSYVPGASYPRWTKFLHDATGDDKELELFLQRAMGYTLTGSTIEKVLFFVWGPKDSGKSTFAEACKAMLGDYATTADFETFLQRSHTGGTRNDIARLAGARMVLSQEVDEGKRLAEGLVKQLTGGDTVSARRLYQEAFEFSPEFKLWLFANSKPQVRAEDAALWRRILLVPFVHSVPPDEQDAGLRDDLRHNPRARAAVLAWAVEGCLAWQQRGLDPPSIVLAATQQYRDEQNPLHEFLVEEEAVFGSELFQPGLWDRYLAWCAVVSQKAIGQKAFGELMRGMGCESGTQKRQGNVRRGWFGVQLRDIGLE
jgi:putative DNA primase/helicase